MGSNRRGISIIDEFTTRYKCECCQFFQESEITLTDVTTITTSNRYTITIDGFDYDYRVQGGDDIDDIGNGLSNSIPAAVMSTTYDDGSNTLSFEGLIAGKYYVIVPNPPVNNGVDISAPVNTNTLKRVTLSGAPDNSATTGTDYFYNITTSSESVLVLPIHLLEVQLL